MSQDTSRSGASEGWHDHCARISGGTGGHLHGTTDEAHTSVLVVACSWYAEDIRRRRMIDEHGRPMCDECGAFVQRHVLRLPSGVSMGPEHAAYIRCKECAKRNATDQERLAAAIGREGYDITFPRGPLHPQSYPKPMDELIEIVEERLSKPQEQNNAKPN